MNKHSFDKQTEEYRFTIEWGALLLDIYMDVGFLNPAEYEWGQERSHNHASYEIHFVRQGRCVMYIEDTYHELAEGSFCVIPPRTYHSQVTEPGHPGSVQKVCFRFDYRISPERRNDYPESETKALLRVLANFRFLIGQDALNYIALLDRIREEMRMQPIGYYVRIHGLLTEILIGVIRSASHPNPGSTVCELPANTQNESRMIVIETFFSQHYNRVVREDELACMLNVSKRQLHRVLHDLYRMSFRRKLVETRMKIAMDMLKHTNLPIKEIALQVGYSTIEAFHATFKTYADVTPAAFRQQLNR